MESIRSFIIGQFVERAMVILTTNGYQTNCGQRVILGEKQIDEAYLPYTVVIPGLDEASLKHGLQESVMEMTVVGAHYFGKHAGSPDEPAALWGERILADLITCFTDRAWDRRRIAPSPESPVTYLPKYDVSIAYAGGGVPEYPEAGMVTVAAVAVFRVTYLTVLGNPYALGGL